MKKRKEKDYYWKNNSWGGKRVYFSDKKQDYIKPSLFWKILIYVIILLAMLLMVLIVYSSKLNKELNNDLIQNKTNNQVINSSKNSPQEKLKVCPEKWYEEAIPCDCNENGCDSCQNQYVLIKGLRYNIEKIDVTWMIKNCNVSLESQKP